MALNSPNRRQCTYLTRRNRSQRVLAATQSSPSGLPRRMPRQLTSPASSSQPARRSFIEIDDDTEEDRFVLLGVSRSLPVILLAIHHGTDIVLGTPSQLKPWDLHRDLWLADCPIPTSCPSPDRGGMEHLSDLFQSVMDTNNVSTSLHLSCVVTSSCRQDKMWTYLLRTMLAQSRPNRHSRTLWNPMSQAPRAYNQHTYFMLWYL